MKTAAILVLALTIALVKSDDCEYKKWGENEAAVEAKFDDCRAKKTGEEFTKCMGADEGTFNNCSSDGDDVNTGIYARIKRCLIVLKKSCLKEAGKYNRGVVDPFGGIYASVSEGERNWRG